MTDPAQPRRKVTSQISLGATSSPSVSSPGSSNPLVPRVRARVTPSSIATPSSPSTPPFPTRPTARSTPSSLSIQSAPVSRTRTRSPAAPLTSTPTSAHTSAGRLRTQGTPGTPNTPVLNRPSISREGSSASTPVARLRTARSTLESPVGIRSPRTPAIRRSNTEGATQAELSNRTRALSLRSDSGPARDGRAVARVRISQPTTPSGTSNFPIGGDLRAVSQLSPQTKTHLNPGSAGSFSSPQLSPGLGITHDDLLAHTFPADGGSTWRDVSPERSSDTDSQLDIHSNRSSPTRRSPEKQSTMSSAQHAMAYLLQHPTMSAPTSPVPGAQASARLPRVSGTAARLLRNPHMAQPAPLPPTPTSPEVRTIDLPMLTPVRSSEEWSRASSSVSSSDRRKPSVDVSASESEMSHLSRLSHSAIEPDMKEVWDRDRLSGATAVDEVTHGERVKFDLDAGTGGQDGGEGDEEVEEVLGADAEEAKVNRKVADLEISNASLLAINKMLEATKAKQRTEIMKLRRMLRETMSGHALSSLNHLSASGQPGRTLGSPLALLSPGLADLSDGETGPEGAYFDDEMVDPQLEGRWDKVADLVNSMKRRGEAAVQMAKEEVRAGPGRVLDWTEVERRREGEEGDEGDASFHSASQDHDRDRDADQDLEWDPDGYEAEGGETSREEVDLVI
ncbi:hypothetical protein IAU60_000339 [Kwoniella sp. DSM 27419]